MQGLSDSLRFLGDSTRLRILRSLGVAPLNVGELVQVLGVGQSNVSHHLGKLKKAGPHTWGEENVPIYCAHCPIVHEAYPVNVAGPGAQFWIHASPFPKKPGDPCIYYIYKDPTKIPAKYYDRIGKKKPA